MIIVLFFSIFLLMLLLPFLPGIREMVRPQDSSPLYINMNYSKDPRYFGKSFRAILDKEIKKADLFDDMRSVNLSKEETVEFAANMEVPENSHIDHVLYVADNLIARERCIFDKEIFVGGKARVGEGCEVRALAANGAVCLGSHTSVTRWVDSEADITAEGHSDLGWSISCPKRLRIGPSCRFQRLFGLPIVTSNLNEDDDLPGHDPEIQDIGDTAMRTDSQCLIIPPATKIDKVIIATQDLLIKKDCVIHGDVKTYGNLILEERVRVVGNLFAEKDVKIGAGSRIMGNIFSQGTLKIGRQVKIGRTGMIKSAVSRKEIELGRDVSIFGYVLTGKKGNVL